MTIDTSIADEPAGSRPPAVLQVLPSLATGGVERGTIEMAQALVASGWNAIVASSGGPMVREVERAGAVHVTLPLQSKNPLVMRANVGRLVDVIERHEVDVVALDRLDETAEIVADGERILGGKRQGHVLAAGALYLVH